METKKINVSDETMNNLYTIFNRKFTKGYLFGDVGEDIMNSNRPNNLGLYIGKVVDYNRKAKRLKIKLENTLKKGDGISIGGGTIGRIIKSNGDIANIGYKGETIELDFIGDAKRNQIIYKTSDSDLLNTVQKTFEEDTENVKVSIDAKIEIKLGKKPRLTLSDSFGNTTTLEADKEVEQAMKVALSEEKVVTQISKLGNTSYIINNITVDMDNNVSLPISILNQIRRDAIESLSEERVAIKNRAYKNKEIAYNPKSFVRDDEVKLRAKVKNIDQLKAIVNYKEIDAIYYEDINTLGEAKTIANENNMNLIYSVPRVLRNKDYKILNKLDRNSNIEIQTGNLGCVSLFKDNGIYIDYYLNSFNSETIKHYKQEGAKTICISQELNLTEIKETLKHTDAEIESVVYGYTPLMISEYCPMGVLVRDCKKDKRSAICNKSVYALKDSKSEVFRITQDIFCRSSIYNSKPLCMIDDLIDVKNAGINVFRLDFTFEDASQVKEVVEAHIEVINNDFEMDTKAKQFYNSLDKIGITKAHYYKGVE
jgi:putative protease